ncbi:MAG: helix-turn-helix domain-containing protein [Actinomycetota bacterium]|nr:helix-turn-helix domain-containing protein [Actinomycetota bacterium]
MSKNDREADHGSSRLPHLLRIDELAQRLGVSERHLRRLVQERRIPSLKVGHFVMFDERENRHLGRPVPAPGGRTPAVGRSSWDGKSLAVPLA